MTAGGDFIPGDNLDARPNYPTVFGLRLTPTTNGWLIAIALLALAGYLGYTFVKPLWDTSQQLSASIAEKESQLINREETQRQIQEARVRLQEAQQLRADVLTLFASNENMDTLLLDLNERVQSANAGITDPDRRATLSKFTLNNEQTGIITDGTYGAAVNNKLRRQVFDVQMQGSFAQTQSIIRSIERLQPLLVVRDFNSELDTDTRAIVLDPQGRLLSGAQPTPRLTTGFRLIALIPAETPAPVPAAGATPGAPTAAPAPGTTPAAPAASPSP
jgi:type IV pilus assembly protein PilO